MKGKGLALALSLALAVSGLQGNTAYAGNGTEDIEMRDDIMDDDDTEDDIVDDNGNKDDDPEPIVTNDDGILKDGVLYQTFDSSCHWKEIQRAFDHTKNGTAKRVEVTLKGDIQVRGRLIVYSDTTIYAQGARITQTAQSGSILKSATAEDYGPVAHQDGYNSTRNIRVYGGTWNGSKISGQVIRFVHSTNVLLDGLTVSGCTPTGHIITFEGVDTGTIRNCNLIGHKDMGSIKEAIHLDIVHSQKTTPGLFSYEYDDLPDRNINIRNNTIVDSANGVGSHAAVNGVYHQNINMVGNTFRNISNTSIRLYNYKNVLVDSNVISNSGIGIRYYALQTNAYQANNGSKTESAPISNNYNINIRQNSLTNIKGAAGIYMLGSASHPVYNLNIEKNIINGAISRGIRVSGYCGNASIVENTVRNALSNAISVESGSHGSRIEKNKINASGAHGIVVSENSWNVRVRHNTVKSSKGNGIWVNDRANNAVVYKNAISGAEKNGILVSSRCKDASVRYNTIKGKVLQHGIDVNQDSSARIEKNEIRSTQQDGVHMSQGSAGTIRKNTINNTNGYGIYVSQSSLKGIENNKIDKSGKSGILLSESQGCSLSKNTITRAGQKGIQVSSSKSSATVSSNTVKNSGDNGIHVYNSKKTEIKGNRVSDARGRGINLGNGDKGCKITDNTVSDTRKEGICSYQTSNVSIAQNSVARTKKTGISAGCAGKKIKISKNRISDTRGTGITVWSVKKATIEKNVLQNVGKVAFRVNDTKSKVKTTTATRVNHVTKKKKVVSGKAREGSKYSVTIGKKNYRTKVSDGSFKSGKISKIKKGTKVKVVEKIACGNQIQTVVKVRK